MLIFVVDATEVIERSLGGEMVAVEPPGFEGAAGAAGAALAVGWDAGPDASVEAGAT